MKTNNSLFIKCIDHSVTGEEFDLIYDAEYDLLKTQPVPKDISSYYESAAYISHTDRKASIFEWVYHQIRKYAIRKKLRHLSAYHPQKGKLLDVGAGTGEFLLTANTYGWEVAGVEPGYTAKQNAAQKGILLEPDLNSYTGQKFDVITLWHVLEHIKDINVEIEKLKARLKDEGTLFVAVPNFKSYDADYYQEYWAAYDVPRHIWHFSRNAIEKHFAKHQMKIIDIIPMKFDAFYVSLLSEKYKNGFMNPFKAFYIGIQSNIKALRSGEYSSLIYVLKKA